MPQVINLLSEEYYPTLMKIGGEASYKLEEGILTGSAVANSPNTYLCSPNEFDDFILDFEVQIDPRLNSGVQIRSKVIQDQEKDALRGYQVEIDPSERAWSGGIYEERDRGWIANLSANPKGKKAFQNGEWNKYHIEAIDSCIRVWVNGINTTNLLDNKTKKGLIGLQVHSIGDSNLIGTKVKWRNIKLYTSNLQNHTIPLKAATPEINLLVNQLSNKEKKEGWNLITMKNSSCLEGIKKHEFIETTGDFEIAMEYTISKGGRAGLVYGQDNQGKDLLTFAILDDTNASKGSLKKRKAGALLDKLEARNLSTDGRHKGLRFHDQWSQLVIKCYNGHVEHWLNNDKVVSYSLNDIKGLYPHKNIFLRTEGDSLCLRSIKCMLK